MTTDHRLLSRRELDRLGYLDATRAAQSMRADADGFRAIAREAVSYPNHTVYGTRAKDYAEGIAARYEILAVYCEYEASRQDGIAADYLKHLGVA